MAWTNSNPVSIGDPTKKGHFDNVFDNTQYNRDSVGDFSQVIVGTGVTGAGVTWRDDLDTYISNPSANKIDVYCGGSSVGFFTSAGFTGAIVPSAVTLAGSAWPSLSADVSGTQSIPNAAWTKVAFMSEVFDTNSDYDAVTNYRFTPTVAGKYLLTAFVSYFASGNFIGKIRLYKNGSGGRLLENQIVASGQSISVTAVVDANGSTDYFEFFTYHNQGASSAIIGSFDGSRIA